MVPYDATDNNCNIGAQLQSITCIKTPKMFWKIYFLYDFWCAQTCSFQAVFRLPVEKNLYRCISTFSALNNCGGIFFKSLSYLYEVVRTNFPPIFVLVAIFYRNFAKTVVPPSDEYENYVVLLKKQSLVKKSCKPRRNRSINGNAILVRTMHASNARCS